MSYDLTHSGNNLRIKMILVVRKWRLKLIQRPLKYLFYLLNQEILPHNQFLFELKNSQMSGWCGDRQGKGAGLTILRVSFSRR